MQHLQRAVEIDPAYDDAMAYLNLLYRERGDLADSAAEYKRDVEMADTLVQRALETKRAKAERYAQTGGVAGGGGVGFRLNSGTSVAAPPPPPPPPPPTASGRSGRTCQPGLGLMGRSGQIDQPATAGVSASRAAGAHSGVVRIRAVVSKDGAVGHLTLLSGHPLLVPAAFTAVSRYQYQSTTLNGVPVEVDTEIEVPFNLP